MKTNHNAWFPHFSPTGKIASGAGDIWAEGVHYGTGWHPRWIDDFRFVFNPGNATHGVIDTRRDRANAATFVPPGANEIAAGGGKYALWTPTGPRGGSVLHVHDGITLNLIAEGHARPYMSREGDLVYCTNYQSSVHAVALNGTAITGEAVHVDPAVALGHVVWSEYTGVGPHARSSRGWRGRGVEDLRVLDEHETEFQSLPILTPEGMFVLTSAHWGFFIRPWGDKLGWMHLGEFYNPDAICLGRTIYVAGSTSSGQPLLKEFPIDAAKAAIHSPKPAPAPLCGRAYLRGDTGACPVCGHPKPNHKQQEQPTEVISMELPRAIYETYAAVARKFASMHAGSDDDRREAHKRGVQTIKARHRGAGDLDGNRYVCKSEHNTGWSAASKDALAYVAPEFGEPVHGKLMKMHMFDMINGSTRQPTAWPVRSRNFSDNPPNPDAYVLIPEPHDWLDGNGEQPGDTHRYDGGGNDTNECDRCGKSRFDPIHFVAEGKVRHDYDGGESDTGLCDICQKDRNDPLHQKQAPGPDPEPDPDPVSDKHAFVGGAGARYCAECGHVRTADIHNVTKPEPGATIDLAPVLAKLDQIIAGQDKQTAATNRMRVEVVKAVKDAAAALPSVVKQLKGTRK